MSPTELFNLPFEHVTVAGFTLIYWAHRLLVLCAILLIVKIVFGLIQTPHRCSPITLGIVSRLVIVAGALTINPMIGQEPTLGAFPFLGALVILLWTFAGGRTGLAALSRAETAYIARARRSGAWEAAQTGSCADGEA